MKIDSKELLFEKDIIRTWIDSKIIEDRNNMLTLKDAWIAFDDWYDKVDHEGAFPKKKDG